MLANTLRISLAALAALTCLAALLCGVRSPAAIVLLAACAPFVAIAALAILSFLVAGVPPSVTWLREYAGFVRLTLHLMPFAPGPGRHGAAGGAPVLLVHGYFCNRGAFRVMAERLGAAGFDVESHDLEPVHTSIDNYVPALAARIESIAGRAADGKVPVVCHSMGGLAMRAYLRTHGPGNVSRLVTLGTPHVGTRLAFLGFGANVRQMRPGSSWLQDLAASEREAARPPVTAVMSDSDNIVAPQDNARLAGAEDVLLEGLGHVELLFHDTAFAAVMRALSR